MAKFNMVGLDKLEADIARRASLLDDAAPEMLNAGTDVLVEYQRGSIIQHGLVDSADMLESIKAGPLHHGDGGYYQEVWPQGKDHKGVPNATKGFVHEYGSSKVPATHWMSEAAEGGEEDVVDAMRKVWNEYAERTE